MTPNEPTPFELPLKNVLDLVLDYDGNTVAVGHVTPLGSEDGGPQRVKRAAHIALCVNRRPELLKRIEKLEEVLELMAAKDVLLPASIWMKALKLIPELKTMTAKPPAAQVTEEGHHEKRNVEL